MMAGAMAAAKGKRNKSASPKRHFDATLLNTWARSSDVRALGLILCFLHHGSGSPSPVRETEEEKDTDLKWWTPYRNSWELGRWIFESYFWAYPAISRRLRFCEFTAWTSISVCGPVISSWCQYLCFLLAAGVTLKDEENTDNLDPDVRSVAAIHW